MSKNKKTKVFVPDLIEKKSTKNFMMSDDPNKDVKGNRTTDARTEDTFVNFMAGLGIQGNNMSSGSQYQLGPFISRNRLQLEAAYRDSWLVGRVVDCIAEDMTKAGVDFFSDMAPKDIQKLQVAISTFGIWHSLCNAIKWARLYGGCIAVMLIDGANYEKPLNMETIGKGKFKGLVVLDRWMIQPSLGELITEINKDMGMPEFYEILPGVSTFQSQRIHYTRVLRFEGIEMPYYQKLFENMWGISVVERLYDRLLAYDSATQGAAQLMFRAYLRVIGIDGFREALAAGGKAEKAVIKQFQYISQMQRNEGITILDAKDQFNIHQYSFSGISDLLVQFGQQIAGAARTPLIKLFGQSPSGFSTGDTDLRNYYDDTNKDQEVQLRPNLDKLFGVIAMSELGHPLPEDFEFKFVSLWQMSEKEKSEIASADSTTITNAHDNGLITKVAALKELRQQSRVTGRFTNITDDDIKDAENELPPGMPGEETSSGEPDLEEPNDRMGGQDPELADEKGSKNPDQAESMKIKDRLPSSVKRFMDGLKRYFIQTNDDAEFKESDHPRRDDGKFGSGGGGKASKSPTTASKMAQGEAKTPKGVTKADRPSKGMQEAKIDKEGKRITASGKPLPKHIASLKIPPAWTEVTYAEDSKAPLLVKGKDSKGKVQYIYSEKFKKKKSAVKFAIVSELNKKFEKIEFQNDKILKKGKGKEAESALVLKLIMNTGIRPGSDKVTQAKIKAYGATTLEGKHVEVKDDKVTLHFIGKKGVDNKIPIDDKELAKTLIERKKKAGDNGRLFGVSGSELLKHSSSLDGGGFKTKDFRTLLGTKHATELVKTYEKTPSNEREYKRAVMSVAREVAQKLGNTASVALKSYIAPQIWQGWKESAGL